MILSCHTIWLLSLCLGLPSREIEGYADSLALAQTLSAQGRIDEAVVILNATALQYPQDYKVAVELGRLEYQRGDFQAARAHYQRAMSLSGPGGEAQLELAWTHLALGEPRAARRDFAEVLRSRPQLEPAQRGLRISRAAWPELVTWAAVTGHSWAGHPAKQYAGAASAGVIWRPWRAVHLGAQYRGASFLVRDPQALEDPLGAFAQHEAWATLGYDTPRLALLGTYGLVIPLGQPEYEAHILAVSVGHRGVGALWVDGALGLYDGLTWGQGAVDWRLPLGRGFALRPCARVQLSEHQGGGGAGGLDVSWQRRGFALWLGGSYGRELRPISLRPAVVYNVPEYVRGGGRAGLRVKIASGWSLFAEYELQWLEPRLNEGDYDVQLHLLTVGFSDER